MSTDNQMFPTNSRGFWDRERFTTERNWNPTLGFVPNAQSFGLKRLTYELLLRYIRSNACLRWSPFSKFIWYTGPYTFSLSISPLEIWEYVYSILWSPSDHRIISNSLMLVNETMVNDICNALMQPTKTRLIYGFFIASDSTNILVYKIDIEMISAHRQQYSFSTGECVLLKSTTRFYWYPSRHDYETMIGQALNIL